MTTAPLSPRQRRALTIGHGCYLALAALCLAWETILAPLHPGGSSLALKVLPLAAPLLFPLGGLLRGNPYTLQWTVMLLQLYLLEGVTRAASDPAPSAQLALAEVLLALGAFAGYLVYLRPFKQAAKRAKQALQTPPR